MYIDDNKLTKEIIISIGKGKLTPAAENMVLKVADHLFKTHKRMYYLRDSIYYMDICSAGIEAVLRNWHKFNYKKYDSAFRYITEIIKRGQTKGYNDYIANKDSRGDNHFTFNYDFYNLENKKGDL